MIISLNELKELARIVDKNKVKNIQIIGTPQLPKTKFDLFYEGLILDQFEDDLSASDYFYNKSPNHSAYKKLKERLSERMLNTLFFIDVNNKKFDAIQTAYYTCYKNLAAEKTLLGRNAKLTAVRIAKKTLQKSMYFEFTYISLALANDLRRHYSCIVGNYNKYLVYNELVKKYSEIYYAELKAEEFYTELMINFVNSNATKPELLNLAKIHYDKLRKIISTCSSYRLNLTAFIIFSLRYELENNHEKTLEICTEALEYFEEKNHLVSNTFKFTFKVKILQCHIHLKNFEKAEKIVRKCIYLVLEGSVNYFKTMELYMITCFHSNQFQKSYKIFLEGIHHPRFKYQYENISEQWRIFEAFIYYLILKKKIQSEVSEVAKKFRINKFLNNVPIYSRDKRGTNISILILQVLFLLEQKKYQKIRDRVEALQAYTHRYLRKDHTYRSNCFIKMLLQLPKSRFNRIAVKRKAAKYKEKLENASNDIAKQSSLIEIIPYETLWEYILNSLDNKFH